VNPRPTAPEARRTGGWVACGWVLRRSILTELRAAFYMYRVFKFSSAATGLY